MKILNFIWEIVKNIFKGIGYILWKFIKYAGGLLGGIWVFTSILTFWFWIPGLVLCYLENNPTINPDEWLSYFLMGLPGIILIIIFIGMFEFLAIYEAYKKIFKSP